MVKRSKDGLEMRHYYMKSL